MTTSQLPARSQIVAEHLKRSNASGEVIAIDASARTANEAALALNCEVGAIVNSLIFIADDQPLLILTSGRHKVDTDLIASNLSLGHIKRATPDEVREATGQAIGGVAPIGHPAPVRTIIDEALNDYPVVWAAGGTPHTIFPTSYAELLELTGGRPLKVGD